MKKAGLLLLFGAMVSALSCQPGAKPDSPEKDQGEAVDLTGLQTTARRIFVLNEGQMGSNNASLDVLRIPESDYLTGWFRKMNPEAGAGLGDVGNDIRLIGDQLWIVVNNSGIVEVLSAEDGKEIAAIPVPTPRALAFDEDYVYVTSWAGAFTQYTYDDQGNATLTDSNNPKGRVYRIRRSTRTLDGDVEVGYQPEGIACQGGRLYVANSGGISSQLAPDYAYDNTVSLIDTQTFTVTGTLSVTDNLKDVYADGNGHIYLTSLGIFYATHSSLWIIESDKDPARKIADCISAVSMLDGTLYYIGNEEEWDFKATERTWTAGSCKDGAVTSVSLHPQSGAYGLCALGEDQFLVADAGDFFNPGTVSLYRNDRKVWTVSAGVCPGHFAIL